MQELTEYNANGMTASNGECLIYHPNETLKLDVKLYGDSVWLTQSQISELFGTQRPAITKHLANIFKCGELEEKSVSSILEHTASDALFAFSKMSVLTKEELLSKVKS